MKKIARFLVPVCFAVVLLMGSCISNMAQAQIVKPQGEVNGSITMEDAISSANAAASNEGYRMTFGQWRTWGFLTRFIDGLICFQDIRFQQRTIYRKKRLFKSLGRRYSTSSIFQMLLWTNMNAQPLLCKILAINENGMYAL